jgi:hypothetical protein
VCWMAPLDDCSMSGRVVYSLPEGSRVTVLGRKLCADYKQIPLDAPCLPRAG